MIMFFDFETNGLPRFNDPSEDPRQPHIVQAAAALVDPGTWRVLHRYEAIVRPEGWEIPAEVAAIHGITTEYAQQVGAREHDVVAVLREMWAMAALRVAHNETFDARIMRIALMRFASEQMADQWKAGRAECTAKLATPVMKLPPTQKMLAAGRKHYKKANLGEAYQHFTGRPLEGAHTAGADVDACIAIYRAITANREPFPLPTPAGSGVVDAGGDELGFLGAG